MKTINNKILLSTFTSIPAIIPTINCFNFINYHHLISENSHQFKWNFQEYMPDFFSDKIVNQMISGATKETKDQTFFATNEGLYLQTGINQKPILIRNTTGNDEDFSHYSYNSIFDNSGNGKTEFLLNVTTNDKNPIKMVLVMSFSNPKDFTTAILKKIDDFIPSDNPNNPIKVNQVAVVNNLIYGIYQDNDGNLGLAWKNDSKGSTDCKVVDTFSKMQLNIKDEKYIKMSADEIHNRLYVSTYAHSIVVFNSARTQDMYAANFAFDQLKPTTPKIFSAVAIQPTSQDVLIGTNEGIYSITEKELENCEQSLYGFVYDLTIIPGLTETDQYQAIFADANNGLWVLENNILFYSESSDTIGKASFVTIDEGLSDNIQLYSMRFELANDSSMQAYISTNDGIFVGQKKEFPAPTPKPSSPTNGLSAGAITGLVIGGVALAGIGIGASVYFLRKKSASN